MHRHERFFENVQRCRARLQLTASDRVAIPVPLFHMYGLGAGFLPSLSAGASVDLQKGANLLRYIQREQAFNPNVAFLTPIFCEMLLKGRHSTRPYRMTVAAGDRVRPHTLTAYEEQFGCLVKLYGSTEMGVMAAASPTDSLEIRSGSVGLPLEGTTFRLAPPPTEVPPELEGLGELWCHNPYGFEGYLDREGTPLVDGSEDFRTKDFGQISPDGRITVVGRCDYSVNRDGLLVFFADIERAIESLDSVEMSVVVAKGESSRGKGLVAYCVPAKDHNPVIAEIRAHCFEHLPKRAVPDSIEILKTLPLLPNGKVDRQALIQR
jgi:acyl-CoA synthetase (AMP-forming)/AMP-acid ligase II